jgi:hypothetical protein
MSDFDYKLRWNIPNAPIHQGIILCGSCEFLRNQELQNTLKHLGTLGFNVRGLNPELDPDFVVDVLTNYVQDCEQDSTLFFSDEDNVKSSKGTVWVFDDWDKANATHKALVAPFMKSLKSEDIWILNVQQKKSIAAAFKPSLPPLEYPEIKPWRMGAWLVHRAANFYGLKLEDKLADDIISNFGSEMSLLDNDLQKAKILLKDIKGRSFLTPQDASLCFVAHDSMKPWKLLDAWQSGNTRVCVQILKKLFAGSNDPSMVLTKILATKIERLIWAREAFDKFNTKPSGLLEKDWDSVIEKSGLPAKYPAQKDQAKAIIQKRTLENLLFSYGFLHTIECEIRRGYPPYSRYLLWLASSAP